MCSYENLTVHVDFNIVMRRE